MAYYTPTVYQQNLCKEIVDSAYRVHREIGPGLLEKVYEACFCYELNKRGIPFERQVTLPIKYDDRLFNEGLRADVMVDQQIICELKSVELLSRLSEAQIISHLKLTGLHIGFLINFNVVLIKQGIRRYSNK